MFKTEKIDLAMASAGFDAWGVVRAEKLSDAKRRFEGWLAEGCAEGLDYLARNVEKRFDAEALFEGARTIVVGAVSYKNALSMHHEAEKGLHVASYAVCPDYHTVLKNMFRSVALELGVEAPGECKICVDSVPLAEKSLARLAGIGWQGRNSLIINPQLGSFVVLGELILRDECDQYSEPYQEDGCVGCGRCLLRCPTGAIRPDRTINATLCIANRTIEQRGEDESFDTHGWYFGCDECQSCCPHNATSPLSSNPLLLPLFDATAVAADHWQTLSAEQARSLYPESPLLRKFRR